MNEKPEEKYESTLSGTDEGYYVEARHSAGAKEINGFLLDKEWKRIYFEKAPPDFGVPTRDFHGLLVNQGLHNYPAVQALRWWFHANAEMGIIGAICLETRLVKCFVEYSVKVKRDSEHLVIGGEDRSNCSPDWAARNEAAKNRK